MSRERLTFDSLAPGDVFELIRGDVGRFMRVPGEVRGFNAVDWSRGTVRWFSGGVEVRPVGWMLDVEVEYYGGSNGQDNGGLSMGA